MIIKDPLKHQVQRSGLRITTCLLKPSSIFREMTPSLVIRVHDLTWRFVCQLIHLKNSPDEQILVIHRDFWTGCQGLLWFAQEFAFSKPKYSGSPVFMKLRWRTVELQIRLCKTSVAVPSLNSFRPDSYGSDASFLWCIMYQEKKSLWHAKIPIPLGIIELYNILILVWRLCKNK